MTVLWDHHGSGAADELDITNTAGPYGSTWNTISKTGAPTFKYDTAHPMHSTTSLRWTRPTSADSGYALAQLATSVSRLQFSCYVWMDNLPATALDLFVFRNATPGFMGYLAISPPGGTANRLALRTASGGLVGPTSGAGTTTATANFPLSQIVRIDVAISKGTTTTDGKFEYAYFLGDDLTTPLGGTPYTITNTNTGTVDPQAVRVGINGATTTPPSIWYGRPRLGDGATGYIGPVAAPSPDRDWMTWDGAAWV